MIIEAFLSGCAFTAAIIHGRGFKMIEGPVEEPPLDSVPTLLLSHVKGRKARRFNIVLDNDEAECWLLINDGLVIIIGRFVKCKRDAPPMLLATLMSVVFKKIYGEDVVGDLFIYRLVEHVEVPTQ